MYTTVIDIDACGSFQCALSTSPPGLYAKEVRRHWHVSVWCFTGWDCHSLTKYRPPSQWRHHLINHLTAGIHQRFFHCIAIWFRWLSITIVIYYDKCFIHLGCSILMNITILHPPPCLSPADTIEYDSSFQWSNLVADDWRLYYIQLCRRYVQSKRPRRARLLTMVSYDQLQHCPLWYTIGVSKVSQ